MNKLQQAIISLIFSEPFYGHLISKMRITKTDKIGAALSEINGFPVQTNNACLEKKISTIAGDKVKILVNWLNNLKFFISALFSLLDISAVILGLYTDIIG